MFRIPFWSCLRDKTKIVSTAYRFLCISKDFDNAVAKLKTLKKEAGAETKLRLYALYKQASDGPCNTPAPGMFDFVGQKKHEAWSLVGNMSMEDAKKTYAALVNLVDQPSTTAVGSTQQHQQYHGQEQSAIPRISFPRRNTNVLEMKPNTILLKTDNETTSGILTVQLNRPSRSNAFNMEMWQDLLNVFGGIEADHRVKVVILTGNDNSFSSGMDLAVFAEMQQISSLESCEGRRREALVNLIQYFQDCVSAPENCCVPVIAAVSGHCIGGEVDLLTSTDLRYCTDDSSFCIKETDLAMVADIGTLQRMPKIVGDQLTRELAYTGRTFRGKEAEQMGLVLKSFSTVEEMHKHVQITAATIAAKSPLTIRGIKKSVLFARDNPNIKASLEQIKLWNAAMLFSNDLMTALSSKNPQFKGE